MLNLPLQVCLVSTVQVLLHLFPDSDPEQISLVMKGTMLVLSCNADLNSPSSLRTNSLLILIRFWTEMRKWRNEGTERWYDEDDDWYHQFNQHSKSLLWSILYYHRIEHFRADSDQLLIFWRSSSIFSRSVLLKKFDLAKIEEDLCRTNSCIESDRNRSIL